MKTVLIYSGGLDSTVLLYHLVKVQQHEVHALSVYYGQRHAKEIEAARQICSQLEGLKQFEIAQLNDLHKLLGGSSQTSLSIPVPEGHYTDESMKATVVPNRNMLLLALGTAWAVSLKADYVAYAAHAGDHAIYPDCRQDFADAMEDVIALCDWSPPSLVRPFITDTKAEIVAEGARLGVPFGMTWSCYKGGLIHCGKCGTCVERREAFEIAQVQDPTEYEA